MTCRSNARAASPTHVSEVLAESPLVPGSLWKPLEKLESACVGAKSQHRSRKTAGSFPHCRMTLRSDTCCHLCVFWLRAGVGLLGAILCGSCWSTTNRSSSRTWTCSAMRGIRRTWPASPRSMRTGTSSSRPTLRIGRRWRRSSPSTSSTRSSILPPSRMWTGALRIQGISFTRT